MYDTGQIDNLYIRIVPFIQYAQCSRIRKILLPVSLPVLPGRGTRRRKVGKLRDFLRSSIYRHAVRYAVTNHTPNPIWAVTPVAIPKMAPTAMSGTAPDWHRTDVDCFSIDACHSRCLSRHICCRPVDDDIGSEQATLLVPAPPLPNRRSTASIFLELRDIRQWYLNCYESRIIDSSCFRRRISMRSGIVDSLAS